MQTGLVLCYVCQSDTAYGACFRAEVLAQEWFTQSYALKDLGSTIRADGADAHLRHNLEESLAHCLYIVLLGCFVVLLYFTPLDQVVQYGKRHVGADGACSITQEQSSMHHLAYFTAFHDEGSLHTLAHAYQMVVHCAYSQQ